MDEVKPLSRVKKGGEDVRQKRPLQTEDITPQKVLVIMCILSVCI